MADVVDGPTRSRMMAGIRGKDTKPELVVRRALHRAGFRYRLHVRTLPGCPDILLPKHRAAIFVHGCFWHRHPGCRFTTTPSTRPEFWREKFVANIVRDEAAKESLLKQGWRVGVIWECGTRRASPDFYAKLFEWIKGREARLDLGEFDAGLAQIRDPA